MHEPKVERWGLGGYSTWALSWAQILGHVNLTNVVPLCATFIPFPFPFLLNQLRPINYQTVFCTINTKIIC